MNYSNINVVISTYLKVDRSFKQKLSNIWYKSCAFDDRRQFKYIALGSRFFHTSHARRQVKKDGVEVLLSPQEVTVILRKNEYNKDFPYGSVKSYDSNQLSSNVPIEDTRCEARCKMTSGFLMGVFDGHGGPACAQVISKRLFKYIAAALLPLRLLQKYIKQDPRELLIETFNDRAEIVQDLKSIYDNSFNKFLNKLLLTAKDEINIEASLKNAIMELDRDLSREVVDLYKENNTVNHKTLSVALSGAVACMSYIDGPHMYVANVGDCNAVVGTMNEDNEWFAQKITKEHNTENFDELKRIWNEHPDEERKTVIRRDRLLGELAPLRSLGDYRYKWPTEILSELVVPLIGQKAIPANYYTPPYLTAKPDIFYHRLTPKDKFLIIASDGLWDMMTPLQAVKLVGEHMKGKVFFNPLKLPKKNIQLGDLNDLLMHRKESLKSKPKDRNAATHLIRHAIGGTEYGVDHSRLAHLLSLSPDVSRMFRDDMTVTVVYFDSEYLRQCPA
ncbi:pyruvate dehydrogenase [acetyl-transferring]-phosphatase 1, mitochondrial [Vanessa tameamea]|uniref:Pyruvate dehydrogenase [acetyl-transferring]-phosphatase 1, mitochondrial n=1 Tax=Vanessa tameamea TaxID=334116 RepID=A0A8B8IXQ9_VANTA|nr:pyruvate dehydrogenase [acetyl-transferring]-phosphatase 1, mitochondrial [Vanessa tameamea]